MKLKTIDSQQVALYVISLPDEYLQSPLSAKSAFAVPVMQRREGALIAVPPDYVAESILGRTEIPVLTDLVGPSRQISVPGVEEEEDGVEVQAGVELVCMLIDFHSQVLDYLKEFDAALDSTPNLCFSLESPQVLPSSSTLLACALEWIGSTEALPERVLYYSAAEEEDVIPALAKASQKQPPVPQRQKITAPAPLPKKVTNAVLAENFNTLAQVIPQISGQLQELQERQLRFEQSMQLAQSPKPPPHRTIFPTGSAGPAELRAFAAAIGPPPKQRSPMQTPVKQALGVAPREEPILVPSDEGFQQEIGFGNPQSIPEAFMLQSQALTTLVSHLINQDSLGDISSGSSSSLSTKGSAKRERLRAELAARSGNFFLQVSQNAFRRIKPGEEVPKDLAGFNNRSIFAKYFEKQGGFAGHRDLGLVAWLLAQVADQMVQGDSKGAEEILALTLVAIEQAAQDSGRWELAWLLALQEEPPVTLFQSRAAHTNPRVRAFAPLCPPIWTTTALSYIKELDLITSRRLESLPSKKPGDKSPEKEKDKEEGGQKRKPRFPKKPKQSGGENA